MENGTLVVQCPVFLPGLYRISGHLTVGLTEMESHGRPTESPWSISSRRHGNLTSRLQHVLAALLGNGQRAGEMSCEVWTTYGAASCKRVQSWKWVTRSMGQRFCLGQVMRQSIRLHTHCHEYQYEYE